MFSRFSREFCICWKILMKIFIIFFESHFILPKCFFLHNNFYKKIFAFAKNIEISKIKYVKTNTIVYL